MKYGLIGEHLGHSYSKIVHSFLPSQDYILKELDPDEVEGFISKKEYEGLNVTIPYKQKVIPLCDVVSDTAKTINAVNTIYIKDGVIYADNTDAGGLEALLKRNDMDLENKTVAILGSGGTSKTSVYVANKLGAKKVYRVSRSSNEDCIDYEMLYSIKDSIEVIINTTPVGMYPNVDSTPVDLNGFTSLESVCDVVYNPIETKLVKQAKSLGVKAVGGLYMLIMQAVIASKLFTGIQTDPKLVDTIEEKILSDIEGK